jgi:nicotinate-nucleotide pyrophosphorylase (carboxylating)
MIKDNHIDLYGGITPAVAKIREKLGHMVKIEVEADSIERVREALKTGVEIIMLDNMTCEEMQNATALIKAENPKTLVEASGNVTLENIAEVAKTGVDIISLGALTHSVKAFDISHKAGQ